MEQEYYLIDCLEKYNKLEFNEWLTLLKNRSRDGADYLFEKARVVSRKYFGRKIYTRGLIEFTNYCRNNCYYCGIRCANRNVERYRLTPEQIMECCRQGYILGFRTFVLQGGEDIYYNDERMVEIISLIKSEYPECAITLSLGEKSYDSYKRMFDAGADRYLLRHETADKEHYGRLHPAVMSLENRMQCLYNLKEIGYQVGAGFIVGSPGQNLECLAKDMMFLHKLQPHMVGIGPFVSHHDTPFANEVSGSVELTLYMLGLIRLMLPKVLLPATTALGTLDKMGREKGILAGANVVMPNLSPVNVRGMYELYDNKVYMAEESAQCRLQLEESVKSIGYELSTDRGDSPLSV